MKSRLMWAILVSLILHLLFGPSLLNHFKMRPPPPPALHQDVEVTLVSPAPKPTPKPPPPRPKPRVTPKPVAVPRPVVPVRAPMEHVSIQRPVALHRVLAAKGGQGPSVGPPPVQPLVPHDAPSGTGTPNDSPPPTPSPAPEVVPPPPSPISTRSPMADTSAELVSGPLPTIPMSLRNQSLKTALRAQFDIAADGSVSVTLLESSGSAELDSIALRVLSRWRFHPATHDGQAVPSVQRVRIDFDVD